VIDDRSPLCVSGGLLVAFAERNERDEQRQTDISYIIRSIFCFGLKKYKCLCCKAGRMVHLLHLSLKNSQS
jgi:hypothetical protein